MSMLRQLESHSVDVEIGEVYLEPCQISKMMLFVNTGSVFQL